MARSFTVRVLIGARDNATATVKKVQKSFKGLGDFLKNNLVVTLGEVQRAFSAAFRGIQEAATLEGQTQALKLQLAQQGQAFDGFLAKLQDVSRATVATSKLIASSGRALLLGIPAEKIAELLEIARASAIVTGQTVSQAFEDIAVGIGRTSPLILDNLGIVVKIGDANETFAKQLGKTVDQMTAQEKKTALLNAVLKVGTKQVEAFGEAHSKTAEAISQATAAADDFKIGAGRLASLLGTSLFTIVNASAAGWLIWAIGVERARAAFNRFTGDIEDELSARKNIVALTETFEKMGNLGERLGKLRDLQAGKLFGDASEEAVKLGDGVGEVATAAELAQQRLEELGNSSKKTFEDLGVSLETNVSAEIERLQAQLKTLSEAEAAGVITALDFANAKNAIAIKVAELRGELSAERAELLATNSALVSVTESTNRAGLSIGSFADETERTVQGLREVRSELVLTSAGFDSLDASRGRVAAVSGAVRGRGQLILGGTRVRLAGGGSRLTSSPGLSTNRAGRGGF